MAKKRSSRVYVRNRAGAKRYYGDFRDFRDVGGGQEALIPEGAPSATSDRDVAADLAAKRLVELEGLRRGRSLLGVERRRYLREYAAYHLRRKAESGSITNQWMETAQMHLEAAIDFFCSAPRNDAGEIVIDDITDRELSSITVTDANDFVAWLARRPNGRGLRCPRCQTLGVPRANGTDEEKLQLICGVCGNVSWSVGTLSASSQRKYINSLSNLYRRAAGEGYVPPGYNPIAALMEKPSHVTPREADWLEVHEAALLLEAARLYRPTRSDSIGFGHALLAMFLLTGGRETEVLGLEVRDVSLDRQIVHFRPNEWRRLKTVSSRRVVPLWPQLEEILRGYLSDEHAPKSGLLFPSPRSGRMIEETRNWLDAVGKLAGWKAGYIRTRMCRHTYCAARLQTLDRGEPVSQYAVGKELGHGGDSMVRRVYAHLGAVRHRAEAVEFRVAQHEEVLGRRLVELRGLASQQRVSTS